MPTIQTQRARVLAEAVVSNYINEIATRERRVPQPPREPQAAPAARRGRVRPRPRPVLAHA